MTNDGDCKTKHDNSGKWRNNEYSVHNVEAGLEKGINEEENIVLGTQFV